MTRVLTDNPVILYKFDPRAFNFPVIFLVIFKKKSSHPQMTPGNLGLCNSTRCKFLISTAYIFLIRFCFWIRFEISIFLFTIIKQLSTTEAGHTVGPNSKNPPEIEFKKAVKLTDPYSCLYLLQFEIFWMWSLSLFRKRKFWMLLCKT